MKQKMNRCCLFQRSVLTVVVDSAKPIVMKKLIIMTKINTMKQEEKERTEHSKNIIEIDIH